MKDNLYEILASALNGCQLSASRVAYDEYYSLDIPGYSFCTCRKQVIVWLADPPVSQGTGLFTPQDVSQEVA